MEKEKKGKYKDRRRKNFQRIIAFKITENICKKHEQIYVIAGIIAIVIVH